MSIVRTHRKKRNFSTLDNSAPNDIALSYRAKGILWYLLTKPEDWTVRMTDIVKHSPKEGRDAVKSAFKELEDHGYAIRKKVKNEKGHFDWETNIFETKEDAKEWAINHNGLSVDGSPVDGSPVDGSPVDGKMAPIVNKELQKTDKQKTDLKKDLHTKANSTPGEESPSTGSAAGSPSDSHHGKEERSKNTGTTPLPPSTWGTAQHKSINPETGELYPWLTGYGRNDWNIDLLTKWMNTYYQDLPEAKNGKCTLARAKNWFRGAVHGTTRYDNAMDWLESQLSEPAPSNAPLIDTSNAAPSDLKMPGVQEVIKSLEARGERCKVGRYFGLPNGDRFLTVQFSDDRSERIRCA